MAELAESLKKISAVDDALTHWMEAIRGMIATPEVSMNHVSNESMEKNIIISFEIVHSHALQFCDRLPVAQPPEVHASKEEEREVKEESPASVYDGESRRASKMKRDDR